MNAKDQEVYGKCLFMTISYHQMKSEMESRSINFSPCDLYYILTLKLRREILQKNDGSDTLIKQINVEIAATENTREASIGTKYKCCLAGCSFSCSNHYKYLAHFEFVHYNCKSRLTCQFRHNCSRDFPTFSMLQSHVKNIHKKRQSPIEIRQNQLVEQLTKLKCIEKSCGNQSVSNITQLKAHLYTHTARKETVKCLFC